MGEYGEKIIISEKMAESVYEANNYLWSWHEGSSQSGKSVTAALALALIIENAPDTDTLFLAIGYTSSSAKNNVSECGGFGVKAYFAERCREGKYYDYDCLKIRTNTGIKYLVFFGGSTVSSNNAWHGWKVSGFILDEIDRLHQNSIDEVKQRITTIKNAHIIATQNPTNPRHPIYKELEDLQDRGLVYYQHWTLNDNVGMSKEQIERVMNRYDKSSVFYRRFVLGERCVAEALIYHIDDERNIFDWDNEHSAAAYIDSVVVIDTGDTVSATAIGLIGLRRENEGIDVLKEYHHRNADNTDKVVRQTLTDDCETLAEFIKDSTEMLGRRPSAVLFDGSEAVEYEIEQAFRRYQIGVPMYRARKKLKKLKEAETGQWIADRIRYASSLLYKGRLRFARDCKHTIDAFKTAQYNPKLIEKGIEERLDEPQNGTMCDELDMVDYAMIYFKDNLERRYIND